MKNWSLASALATMFALIVSLGLAIAGYVAFGDNVANNILDSFDQNDNLINFARLVLALAMFVTYPMAFYPARDAFNRMTGLDTSILRHTLITTALFSVTLGIALVVTDLGVVYELVGGVCSTMIAYIIPGAVCLALYLRNRKTTEEERSLLLTDKVPQPKSAGHTLAALVLVVFGLFVLVTATFFTLYKIFSD